MTGGSKTREKEVDGSQAEQAFNDYVFLKEAKWTDKDGSTVTFSLKMDGHEGERNPFQQFTKRRGKRAGTRFMAGILSMRSNEVIFENELMLAGWNDSQTSGHTVRFWIQSDTLGHPFEGFVRGDQFYLSLVELDDDDVEVDQDARDKVVGAPDTGQERRKQKLSVACALMCKEELFQTYVFEVSPQHGDRDSMLVDPEEAARKYVTRTLGINSRSELDRSDVLATQFHDEIRKPFLEWQGEEA